MLDKEEKRRLLSDVNKLEILHHTGSIDYFGAFLVEGAVKNLSAEKNINAEIIIDYYDKNGVRIDSDIDDVFLPFPGGSRAFYIVYSGEKIDEISYYKIFPSSKF